MQNEYEIILFYKYVHIEDPQALRDEQFALCQQLGLKGRTIIASEGINGTLEGTKENIEKYLEAFFSYIPSSNIHPVKDPKGPQGVPIFNGTNIKRSVGNGESFPKLSVRVRSEIVTLGLGVCDVDPNVTTGIHLKPEELHQWIKDKREFYIVDMRNAYEHRVGHFEGSVCPPLDNFRDLPKFVESIKHLKDKTVLTVCTGGVRCEKASGFLLTQGFKDVYQLDGGIVSYMEKYPNEDFVGKLYVFDKRVMMGFYTDDPMHQIIGRCEKCEQPSEHFVNCDVHGCHRHFILCESCRDQAEKEGKIVKCPCKCTISRSGNKVRSPFFRKLFSIFK